MINRTADATPKILEEVVLVIIYSCECLVSVWRVKIQCDYFSFQVTLCDSTLLRERHLANLCPTSIALTFRRLLKKRGDASLLNGS